MKTKRKSLSKKTRFEVFKRDKFTCQYCGRSAPDVQLEVDHIKPVSKGGTNDLLNLVTSCVECNRGKTNKLLSDDSVVVKQKTQIKELATKKEQLEMLIEWKTELENIDEEAVDYIESIFHKYTNLRFSARSRMTIKNLIKKYGVSNVDKAMNVSIEKHYVDGDKSSLFDVFNELSKLCYCIKYEEEHPEIRDINYLCKIAENRLYSFDKKKKAYLRSYLIDYYDFCDFENLKRIIKRCTCSPDVIESVKEYYEGEIK